MAVGNTAFNTLATTTLQGYTGAFEESISTQIPLWHFLTEAGRVKDRSGRTFVEELMYGKNTTSKTYALYEDLDITPQDGLTAAEFTPKAHAVTIAIAGLEKAMNSGSEQNIDLLEAKVEQAKITAAEDFEIMFQSDGTGNAGKDFLGLRALIGDAVSAVTVVGGIDCVDALNVWWRSYVERTAGVLKLTDMSTAYNSASNGRDMPQFAQAPQALFEKYESLLQPQQRFQDSKTAQAGFENLTFKGKPIVWGPSVPAGQVTFINPAFLRLNKLDGQWMKATPFNTPVNRDASYSQIISYGNLSVSNRKKAGSRLEGRTV